MTSISFQGFTVRRWRSFTIWKNWNPWPGPTTISRVFLHKHIEVDELKDSTKLFVTDFAGSAEQLLEGVKRDHSTLQTSKAIKDDKPGSILKGGTVRRAKGSKEAKTDSSVGFKGRYVTPFPRNIGNKIPDDIYKQVKSWYLVMAKKDNEPVDMKFLNDFKFEDRKSQAELDATKANKNGGSTELCASLEPYLFFSLCI